MRLDPIRQAEQVRQADQRTAQRPDATGAFADALRQAIGSQSPTGTTGVDFSKHALERLEQRGIALSDGLLQRLNDGVDRAQAKGSKTTLVLVDQTAFVVGVNNRTVVTVADQNTLKDRVFTNIDSMVIA